MSSRVQASVAVFIAAGLHIGGFAALPDLAGAAASGAGGEQATTIVASDGQFSDLVAIWDAPPPTLDAVTDIALPLAGPDALPDISFAPDTAPVAPETALPELPAQIDAPAKADITVPRLQEAPKTKTSPAPEEPKPEPKTSAKAKPTKTESKPSTPKKKVAAPAAGGAVAQKAAGAGGGASAGEGGSAKAGTVSKAKAKSLKAEWGASIRSKIERRKTYPKAAKGASGTVTVRLTVSASGALKSVTVNSSSGNAALDAAAVKAVKAAGRFPAAPKGLADGSHGFTLPMTFQR